MNNMVNFFFSKAIINVARVIFILFAMFLFSSLSAKAEKLIPDYGDTFISGMIGEPSNLIPGLSSDSASSEVSSHFYVALIKYDKDITIVPFATKSFEILDNGLRLRFVLRNDIYWEDGMPLTVDDVEFTYKTMIDPNTPTAYASDYKAIKEFKKIDAHTIEIIYDKPFARSLSTWMRAILPKHILQGQDLRTTPYIRKPVGSGPFTMKEWEPGAMVSIEANPKYFEGRPYIDRVVYKIIPDSSTLFLELKAGKLDCMPTLSPQQYLYQAQKPEFAEKFAVYRTLAFSYTYLGYNLKSPLFSDKRVRQALAYAINKQDIIKGALLGQGEPTVGPYHPEMWAYNTTLKDYSHNIEKALDLFEKAGWSKNSEGILEKNGMPFSFTLLVNQGNESRIKTAVVLQSQLKNIGITVQIRTVEWASFLHQFVIPGLFDAVILAWTIPQEPDCYDVWHSSRADGGLNLVKFANAEADILLEEGRSTFDVEKRKRIYDRLQEILHDEQPYCFLYVPYSMTAVQKRFHGIESAPAGIFHNFNKWWVPNAEHQHKMLR